MGSSASKEARRIKEGAQPGLWRGDTGGAHSQGSDPVGLQWARQQRVGWPQERQVWGIKLEVRDCSAKETGDWFLLGANWSQDYCVSTPIFLWGRDP